MISKVVLRRFVVGGALISHNLRYGTRKPRHPSQVAYRESFISVRQREMEGLWGETEQAAEPALRSMADGSIFDKPSEILALKQLIALHFMRRDVIKDLHDAGLERALANYRPSVDLGPDQERLVEEVRRQVREGEHESHADTQERLFNRSRAQAAEAKLEVTRTGGQPVLIGDQAILSFGNNRATYLPFLSAQSHVLPVGPRHYISYGPRDDWRSPVAGEVLRMNVEQIRHARQNVFYSPADADAFAALIPDVRPPETR